MLSLYPLFPGTNELDQINKIHNVIGTPPPDTLAKLKGLVWFPGMTNAVARWISTCSVCKLTKPHATISLEQ